MYTLTPHDAAFLLDVLASYAEHMGTLAAEQPGDDTRPHSTIGRVRTQLRQQASDARALRARIEADY